MRVLIDGVPVQPEAANISVFDWGLQRGDGCFEMIRCYDGNPHAVDAHLDRLEQSAKIMSLSLPPRQDLDQWISKVAASGGNCAVRVIVTRGGTDPLVEAPPRCIVMWEPLPVVAEPLRLLPVIAPWHSSGRTSELTGAKNLSYGANVAASRTAHSAGFTDALLISTEGVVLEGPTFGVGWFCGDTLETPSLDLGILASITRQETLRLADALGLQVHEGRFSLDRLLTSDEVFALSTIKEITSVTAVGDGIFEPGPLAAKLAASLTAHIEA